VSFPSRRDGPDGLSSFKILQLVDHLSLLLLHLAHVKAAIFLTSLHVPVAYLSALMPRCVSFSP
jgi:hypothetical protein